MFDHLAVSIKTHAYGQKKRMYLYKEKYMLKPVCWNTPVWEKTEHRSSLAKKKSKSEKY